MKARAELSVAECAVLYTDMAIRCAHTHTQSHTHTLLTFTEYHHTRAGSFS